jgi:hypothetical protein
MQPKSFTLASQGGPLRVLVTELKVCEPGAVPVGGDAEALPTYSTIWDTGATNSVITQKIVDALNLQPIGIAKVNGVHGEDTSPVFFVDFILPMGVIIQGLRVTLGKLPEGNDALVGMDVINVGDMAITNVNGNTKMTFRIPSMREIDYVKEMSRNILTKHQRRELEIQARKNAKKQ